MAHKSTWRGICTPIIAKILQDTKGQPESVIRKALIDGYPFGERAMYPYKIWLDEIQRQRKTFKHKFVDAQSERLFE